jgi:hypothetical protein
MLLCYACASCVFGVSISIAWMDGSQGVLGQV